MQIPASVPADEYLLAFVLNFINIFSISSGSGQTECYFPTCTKPCSLCAIVGTNPAIEKVVSNILSILEQSKAERIEPVEIPGQGDEDCMSVESTDAKIQFYSIDPIIYNLFKTIVKRFKGDYLKSMELVSYPLDRGNISDIEELSNHLYEILKDHTVAGLGRFNETDALHISELKIWTGKLWVDYQTGSIVLLDMVSGVTRLMITMGNELDGA